MLHPGYSTHRIAAELKGAGIIRSEEAFVLLHYLHHSRSLKAGEYLFDKPANTPDVQKRLRRGDVYFRTVVPEGCTMFDIAHAVEAAGLGPANDFLKVAQSDTALIADIAPGAHSLEGYLFPETYEFSRMMTMHDMAAAIVKQFRITAHQISLVARMQAIRKSVVASFRSGFPAPQNADAERNRTHGDHGIDCGKRNARAGRTACCGHGYYNRLDKKHRSRRRPQHHLRGAFG